MVTSDETVLVLCLNDGFDGMPVVLKNPELLREVLSPEDRVCWVSSENAMLCLILEKEP